MIEDDRDPGGIPDRWIHAGAFKDVRKLIEHERRILQTAREKMVRR